MRFYAEVLPQLGRNMRRNARKIHIRSAVKANDFAIHERRILIIRNYCPVVVLRRDLLRNPRHSKMLNALPVREQP